MQQDYSWNPSTCFCEIIVCDEIINVLDKVSTNLANNIPTNVTSTTSINSDNEKVRHRMDCYIHTISLVIISLFILLVAISVDCYYYTRRWVKK